ncbi:hypothetical protein NM688_g8704 [Phlebia brevispora]|uniref:Uncharacterized protein n=1 Tax=Phlebia brevispora TaxID=194682 RepID=A0ACC1RQ60_9APHY|nr:hypothetical protein NM688_g8704 [Phlebia brevispora]
MSRDSKQTARFRVKKKQWTLNLERSITDLSGRVEELEREAAELRRENGWLKEIVMLKSKRFGGQAPAELHAQLTAHASSVNLQKDSTEPSGDSSIETESREGESNTNTSSEKGKEVQR